MFMSIMLCMHVPSLKTRADDPGADSIIPRDLGLPLTGADVCMDVYARRVEIDDMLYASTLPAHKRQAYEAGETQRPDAAHDAHGAWSVRKRYAWLLMLANLVRSLGSHSARPLHTACVHSCH
jgi:hypothetical protein